MPNGIGDYANGVCDPAGGYSLTPNTVENVGKINVKRGHRVIQMVVKYSFGKPPRRPSFVSPRGEPPSYRDAISRSSGRFVSAFR